MFKKGSKVKIEKDEGTWVIVDVIQIGDMFIYTVTSEEDQDVQVQIVPEIALSEVRGNH